MAGIGDDIPSQAAAFGVVRRPKRKSLPREEVRQAFLKRTERQLGGGVLSFPQATLGYGIHTFIIAYGMTF
ncbi:hypothetical protein CPT34_18160 [Rhizobium sophoriradicis]|uniref:Uncharacterized protein n=1 Tax=Rhizobium sophoriradicis TaxID=1535245 RepID=A0A2A5KRU7_9HYPH|nr:hypothetical protein CPT34_18160 [Rhizobium sophoriradicis]